MQTLYGFTIISKYAFIYPLELDINLLELNPKYPKEPNTLGERIRNARMDNGLQIKELAKLIGVTPDTVINWEIRGVGPRKKAFEV